MNLPESLLQFQGQQIVIYGIGTETERLLPELSEYFSIIGFLDGYRDNGAIYGYPILSVPEMLDAQVPLVLVVARPGSCKAIAKRIGVLCRENKIALLSIDGLDLLAKRQSGFLLNPVILQRNLPEKAVCFSAEELTQKAQLAQVISMDLFDTLLCRMTLEQDFYQILDCRLQEMGIVFPDFAKKRLAIEKELSRHTAPRLKEIYYCLLQDVQADESEVIEHLADAGIGSIVEHTDCAKEHTGIATAANMLAEFEWQQDLHVLCERTEMCELYRNWVLQGYTVVITTDMFYSKKQIADLLAQFDLNGYADIFVSCEYGTGKDGNLFDRVREAYGAYEILHIGDDARKDYTCATEHGLWAAKIASVSDCCEASGMFGMEDAVESAALSDRVKYGMFFAKLFNNPFFEPAMPVHIRNAKQVAYLFCAPIITDFMLWLAQKMDMTQTEAMWFGARDGYLPLRLMHMLAPEKKGYYVLTSRTAAIRAGVSTPQDLDYVSGMHFFGTKQEELRVRFGVDDESKIMDEAKRLRRNYLTYFESLDCRETKCGFFDFVAKGTTQYYLQKVLDCSLTGFYFLQLEPEAMADKQLCIESFFASDPKSSIYESYYILETILTALHPQVLAFDESGKPVYAKETRTQEDLECVARMQDAIEEYFAQYLSVVPPSKRSDEKEVSVQLLHAIHHFPMTAEDFLALTVEDPFFNRMTDLRDVL
ncbi:hypothetical protein [Agathobacter ruminis]|uniref:Haloacid dehalogenase n=1 Tax=Agathobacter ruminis TaxID=1712665 RepID=A0A2G3DZ16_9FIRM|nr:hypothetical protein [Agathobacter ruminis]MDC7300363.1 hypothetical protein [Agathobacter ruminis]PHU36201.1 hypothetical protein CSX02_13020 [Agathobacter ruminis]